MLEKGSDVGGTWYWNHYPGLSCDVPSALYQYSFHLKPNWQRVFATGEEILAALGPTVGNTGCNSWSRQEDGSTDLWPFNRADLKRMLGRPEDAHFHIERPAKVRAEVSG